MFKDYNFVEAIWVYTSPAPSLKDNTYNRNFERLGVFLLKLKLHIKYSCQLRQLLFSPNCLMPYLIIFSVQKYSIISLYNFVINKLSFSLFTPWIWNQSLLAWESQADEFSTSNYKYLFAFLSFNNRTIFLGSYSFDLTKVGEFFLRVLKRIFWWNALCGSYSVKFKWECFQLCEFFGKTRNLLRDCEPTRRAKINSIGSFQYSRRGYWI